MGVCLTTIQTDHPDLSPTLCDDSQPSVFTPHAFLAFNYRATESYAVTDNGAQICVLGGSGGTWAVEEIHMHRRINIIGPVASMRKNGFAVVNAVTKVIPTSGVPVLLRVNEAAYNPNTRVTLLSEFQIRNHGCLFDSVPTNHRVRFGTSPDCYGTQRFCPSPDVHIPLSAMDALMTFPLYAPTAEDLDTLTVIDITSSRPWNPADCEPLVRHIGLEFTEPRMQQQNPSELNGVKWAKQHLEILFARTGAIPRVWTYGIRYLCEVHNALSQEQLRYGIPLTIRYGETVDISPLLCFRFYEKVYYGDPLSKFPDPREKPGYWLGPTESCGDALTYSVLTDDTQRVVVRSVVRPFSIPKVNKRLNYSKELDPLVEHPPPPVPLTFSPEPIPVNRDIQAYRKPPKPIATMPPPIPPTSVAVERPTGTPAPPFPLPVALPVASASFCGRCNQRSACDVGNAFLYAETREKCYIIAGPEFGDLEGTPLIIHKGLYRLRTSSARFHEHLAKVFREMGFVPSHFDADLWIRPKEDHYEIITTYVDDVLIFSRDPMSIMKHLEDLFVMKGVGVPEYYLG
eukprot:Nitzschia sp. Nitz4//scaffold667_size1867//111//1830//NITZ4_009309-RA/size1867-snap-gene-0.2-mRNA-1//1//CDS//3329556305//191//frame0